MFHLDKYSDPCLSQVHPVCIDCLVMSLELDLNLSPPVAHSINCHDFERLTPVCIRFHFSR